MAVKEVRTPAKFIQASSDTKLSDGSTRVNDGATTLEYDTSEMWVTPDHGANWYPKKETVRIATKTVSVSVPLASLGSYAAYDVLSNSTASGTSWAFAAIASKNGGKGRLTKAQFISDTTGKAFRPTLFLFNAIPVGAALNDNALNLCLNTNGTDTAKYIGKIDWVATETLNSGASEALATPSTYGNLPLDFDCASDADDLFGVLATRDAVALGTGGTVTIRLTAEQY